MAERPNVGRLLARWRVRLGFLSALFVIWFAQPTPASIAWGAAVGGVGEALRLWAAGHLNKSREVTSSGPYQWLPHPLYVGSSIIGAGLAIASASFVVSIVVGGYLVVTLSAAVNAEEAYLRGAFGDRYDRYRGGERDAERRFSVSQAVANREHRALAGWLVALLLLVLKATYNGSFRR